MTHILRHVQYPLDLQSTNNDSINDNITRIEGVDRWKIGKIPKEFSRGINRIVGGIVGGIVVGIVVVGSLGGSATNFEGVGSSSNGGGCRCRHCSSAYGGDTEGSRIDDEVEGTAINIHCYRYRTIMVLRVQVVVLH